jgi:urease gamma subunit
LPMTTIPSLERIATDECGAPRAERGVVLDWPEAVSKSLTAFVLEHARLLEQLSYHEDRQTRVDGLPRLIPHRKI